MSDTITSQSTPLPDTEPLAYLPLGEAWICELHGGTDCDLPSCAGLPWEATQDPQLADFLAWAHEQFDAAIRPFERGEVHELPDDASDAYWPADWATQQPAPAGR